MHLCRVRCTVLNACVSEIQANIDLQAIALRSLLRNEFYKFLAWRTCAIEPLAGSAADLLQQRET